MFIYGANNWSIRLFSSENIRNGIGSYNVTPIVNFRLFGKTYATVKFIYENFFLINIKILR